MTTVPATDFNRNPSHIKRLAADGPVVVTERDRPTLVVLTYEDYERITSAPSGLGTLLQMDEDIDFDFDFEETGIGTEPEGFG
jgi:prevent-host-death family protein